MFRTPFLLSWNNRCANSIRQLPSLIELTLFSSTQLLPTHYRDPLRFHSEIVHNTFCVVNFSSQDKVGIT